MATQKIGRYEVLNELGQGGMAIVFLARDPFMNRQVAIKVLPRQFTFDPQFRARFKREAEAIASLEHPAIVPVYDYGEADEQPFIVMRYMPGGTLSDKIGKPEARTGLVHILQRVGQALDEAHSRGIIHRDLKPSNVLFDAWGEAYLSDFGIAKLAESTGTYSGSMMLGTPAYMSPEQARGERTIDGRSDIYALGVMLFELLTGRKPYEADTPMGMAVKHVTEPVPSILAAKPDLPEVYETIINKALAKDRDARYQKAVDLAAAVSEVMGGAATVLPPMPSVHADPTRVAAGEPPEPPKAAPRTQAFGPEDGQAVAAETPGTVASTRAAVAAPGTVASTKAALAEASPATMASSAVATPVPAVARRPPRVAVGMVIGIAVLALLAVGGVFAFSLINNRPTPTPTPAATNTLQPTEAPPSFTAVVAPPSDTPRPEPSDAPTRTVEPSATNTGPPSATPTEAATATRTQPPTAAVTLAPPTATQPPSGCLALPVDQQGDCFFQATQEESARLTQEAVDAGGGAP